MTRVVHTFAAEHAAAILAPRDDMVREHEDAPGEFSLVEGPFDEYRRTAEVLDDGSVRQTVEYRLAIPVWGVLFQGVIKAAMRRVPEPVPEGGKPAVPWWSPPDLLSARTARVISLTCVLSYFSGYMGTLMTQTNTFFKEEFDASNGDVSWVLTAVRIGAFLALGVTALADRRGRVPALTGAAVLACGLTVLGGLSPGLVVLGLTQTLARTFTTSIDVLARVYTAEEVPANSRAFAISVITMTGALGAGNAVILISFAEQSAQAWRLLYIVPLLFLVPAIRMRKRLPESDRFLVHEAHERAGDDFDHVAPPEVQASDRRMHRRRFLVLGASAFLFAVFFTPQSNYLNEYLRDEQGFSASRIALFQIATNLPGGIGIVVGGRLADSIGRRKVGAVAVVVGVSANLMVFLGSGASIWVFSTISALIGAAAVPALFVYGPELFPTASRSRVNGGLNLLAVLGAVTGLQLVGNLSDAWGTFGTPIALTAIGPALVVVLVLLAYPETAHRSLEELNPEDDLPPPGQGPAPPLGGAALLG